jgi:hypothetical protein
MTTDYDNEEGMRKNHANGFKIKCVVAALIDRKSARLSGQASPTSKFHKQRHRLSIRGRCCGQACAAKLTVELCLCSSGMSCL